jgi:hypothetical protein
MVVGGGDYNRAIGVLSPTTMACRSTMQEEQWLSDPDLEEDGGLLKNMFRK